MVPENSEAAMMVTRAASQMMLSALAIASFSSFSPFLVALAADVVVKLPPGSGPGGAFMPFAFGGVHTTKGNCSRAEKRERVLETREEKTHLVDPLFWPNLFSLALPSPKLRNPTKPDR